MSVTFSVYVDGKFVSPDGWEQTYEIDEVYGKIPANSNPLEMNVANVNFVRLMNILDESSDDYCGTWKAKKLIEINKKLGFLVQSFKAMPEVDSGIPSEQQGNFIDCGLREGYFTEKLTKLIELVNVAIAKGGCVTFG